MLLKHAFLAFNDTIAGMGAPDLGVRLGDGTAGALLTFQREENNDW